ncbi:lipid IV(A) 3-deoxy-D-manno-octulosonic acid transferase [Oleiagrimonas sp. C23AA]|uniref:lipid IV(A) 3-deoxy-D-manno-octulosonic acid transferase n=1 Tax=Oleiagrimonas sp. C23AA TaxID=2719047 RepID=UPI001423E63C|nr:lipid IV(A) 3-deoxy-D-manno-octulosonic acid transferase [Oleiagrimonas sp. C23AA]NII12292.1 3-deoxy-D-manno-octulosonic acid transferase [Oleiagrimonas sp. C23AA]
MRLLYTLAMYLATPLFLLRLMARGVRYGDYHKRWRERFGLFRRPRFTSSLWVHAVSLGEVNAAEPLINAMLAQYPDWPLVVTTVTPTGSERVRQLFGERVFHVYLPYDLPFSVRRFLRRVRPRLGVIVETEIWPNLYFACRDHGVALMIANARLSARSLRGYAPARGLVRDALSCVTYVAAQSRCDAARYRLLGADPGGLTVAGNLKFDMPLPREAMLEGAELCERWGRTRPVWMAASTHEGEEVAVLQAHRRVLQAHPDALLLLAPRHPERFRGVEQVVREHGIALATRSGDGEPGPGTQCFLIDAMGELMRFYAAADVAFVGGSLVAIGGHNVLEPAALGRPVLVGPYTFNFDNITEALVDEGGARRVADADALAGAVLSLLEDTLSRERMGEAACVVFDRERGAVGRIMGLVEQVLAAR